MMQGKRIDLKHYPRKEHFHYFMNMAYPYVGTTVNVDITEWMHRRAEMEIPFFLGFLHAVGNAANEITALRQRIDQEGIVEFEQCKASYTVGLEDGTYCYCSVSCDRPLDEFIAYARKEQESAMKNPTISDGEEPLSLLFISSLPWLSYTSLVQPVPIPADSNPRITWGKYFDQEGKILIPVSILCHHALVDGIHLSQFYDHLKERLII